MGIRFERDRRKATNGPLIFFSIMRDEAFEEEIRGAFVSGLSFYAYRFPGESMMNYGSSEGYTEGIKEPGFVIGMFDPELPYITIPYSGIKRKESASSLYKMPERSTTREEYFHEVEEIKDAIDGNPDFKVVAARVKITEGSIDIAEKFYDLCERFPDSFVYCFATPATGCWIGATPELLLESQGTCLRTMALAGTRETGSCEDWDPKNIEEQKIVTDYILDVFKGEGLETITGKTHSKTSGDIEHICTPVTAFLKEDAINDLSSLLKKLSPTPALCGYPKDFALDEIKRLENFERGCYGGFCGPYRSLKDFSFNVTLRCASVTEKKYCCYAGGGITSLSNPESEWMETEWKMRAVEKF